MENKLSLSVILPIKSAKAKDFDEYFAKSINSLKEQKVNFIEALKPPKSSNTDFLIIEPAVWKF